MIWLSLGENCLPDDILKRHGLKSFSTPFSSGRTNIDYVIQADRTDFAGLLEPHNLVAAEFYGQPVVRSKLYSCDSNMFCPSVSQGFEITHHDVINRESDRKSWERKIARWLSAREDKEPVTFLYHYRLGVSSRVGRLVEKLKDFASGYAGGRANKCRILVMYQEIARDEHSRGVDVANYDDSITVAKITSQHRWAGKNFDHFWARCDDDLIAALFHDALEPSVTSVDV